MKTTLTLIPDPTTILTSVGGSGWGREGGGELGGFDGGGEGGGLGCGGE